MSEPIQRKNFGTALRRRLMAIFAACLLAQFGANAQAQQGKGLLAPGDAAVTGFSGAPPPPLIAPGESPAARTFIDLDGPSLRVVDLQNMRGPPVAQLVGAPKSYSAKARDIGQVFGVALDDAAPPNIYAAASSAYGLPIVLAGPDGIARHVARGAPGAKFMDGLWGQAHPEGGPGSIWKIDGVTGAITLFANVTLDGRKNSGPALGGLAYDAPSKSLYVADRETGFVHRLDAGGALRDRYDHGQTGRATLGLPPVAFDASRRLDIQTQKFDSGQPATWAYAPPDRLVFALAVAGRRLYYSVASGLQIWSVGLADDGSFKNDPRIEITVPPAAGPTEISKIAFDEQGRMFLAERPASTGAFDFEALSVEGVGRVLRYAAVGAQSEGRPLWQALPTEYPIGFARALRNANGGLAIGYSYDASGRLRRASCGGFLWASGEDLRDTNDATAAARLNAWGPPDVQGLQGAATWLAMHGVNPPWRSYFVDYDDHFEDTAARGHMGDLAIWRDCGGAGGGAFAPFIPSGFSGPPPGGGGGVSPPGGARPPKPPRTPPSGGCFAPLPTGGCQPPPQCSTPGGCQPPPNTCPSGFVRRGNNNCEPQTCPAPSALIGGSCCAPGSIGAANCSYCPPGQISVGPSNYCCTPSQVYTGANGVSACCAGQVVNGQCQPNTPVKPPQCAPNTPNCCASGYVASGGACCLAGQLTSTGICCPAGQTPSGPNRGQCLPTGGGGHPPGVCCPAGQAPALNGQCCATSNITTQGVCCSQAVNPQTPYACPAQIQSVVQPCASGYTKMPDGSCCRDANVSSDGKTCRGGRNYTPLPVPPPGVLTPPVDCGARGPRYVRDPHNPNSCRRCPRGSFANSDRSDCVRGPPPPRPVYTPPVDEEPPPYRHPPRHRPPPPDNEPPPSSGPPPQPRPPVWREPPPRHIGPRGGVPRQPRGPLPGPRNRGGARPPARPILPFGVFRPHRD